METNITHQPCSPLLRPPVLRHGNRDTTQEVFLLTEKTQQTYHKVSRFFANNKGIVFLLCDINQLRLRNNKAKERIIGRVCCTNDNHNLISNRQIRLR